MTGTSTSPDTAAQLIQEEVHNRLETPVNQLKKKATEAREEVKRSSHRDWLESQAKRRELKKPGEKNIIGLDDPQNEALAQKVGGDNIQENKFTIDNYNITAREGVLRLPPAEQERAVNQAVVGMQNSPLMSDVMSAQPDDATRTTIAHSLITGEQSRIFDRFVEERVKELYERQFDPNSAENKVAIVKLIVEEKNNNPKITHLEANKNAIKKLHEDFKTTLQHDFQNVYADAVGDVLDYNMETTQKSNKTDAEAGSIPQRLTDRMRAHWDQPGAYRGKGLISNGGTVINDSNTFFKAGLDGLDLTREEKEYFKTHPEEKAKMEQKLGEDILSRRFRAGKLKTGDLFRLADAEWLGATPKDRMKKIQDLFQDHNELKRMITEGQKAGIIQANFWDTLSGMDRNKKLTLLGLLLALLALPFAAAAVALPAILVGAGTVATGAGAAATIRSEYSDARS